MNFRDLAFHFRCADSWLIGIVSLPDQPASRGVLIVVGGPQYRAGSHRQFTLLARHLASHGVAAMRFDYRGMGDSEGGMRSFEDIGEDLDCAARRFFEMAPMLKDIAIWGLCDAAPAALFHAYRDPRVAGLVLLNPWIRSEAGAAKAYLKHYYRHRLLQPELWKKVFHGEIDFGASLRSLMKLGILATKEKAPETDTHCAECTSTIPTSLAERMRQGLERFTGRTLIIISGNDLTAREFSDLVKGSRKWRTLLASPRLDWRDLPKANHTFSRREWRDQVATWTTEWIKSW